MRWLKAKCGMMAIVMMGFLVGPKTAHALSSGWYDYAEFVSYLPAAKRRGFMNWIVMNRAIFGSSTVAGRPVRIFIPENIKDYDNWMVKINPIRYSGNYSVCRTQPTLMGSQILNLRDFSLRGGFFLMEKC